MDRDLLSTGSLPSVCSNQGWARPKSGNPGLPHGGTAASAASQGAHYQEARIGNTARTCTQASYRRWASRAVS